MAIVESASSFLFVSAGWSTDWAWGLVLIVLTVVVHVLGLGLINEKVVHAYKGAHYRHRTAWFAVFWGGTTLLATLLHGLEASIWAIAYHLLNAIPETKSAMLYSLNAITSYGHTSLTLETHWQLMGAMESVNGWLLFGLTTAFLFGAIEKFASAELKRETREA